MADTVLKFENPKAAEAASRALFNLKAFVRGRLRPILLVVVPSIAALIGLGLYFTGGRYISTDNSYVGAQKVLVTPDVSGRVARAVVKEGQRVAAGDVLFEIDPVPFQIALTQAQSKLEAVRVDFAKLKSNLQSLGTLLDLAQKNVEIKQRNVERKTALAKTQAGSAADLDNANAGLVAAQLQAENAARAALGRSQSASWQPGSADRAIPALYHGASCAGPGPTRPRSYSAEGADRRHGNPGGQHSARPFRHRRLAGVERDRRPARPWVDANPKETDVTFLRAGEKAEITVDAFPDRVFHGTVSAVSPGTGSQFAILPPQNASGNWVKVVQRVPVRIVFDAGEDVSNLSSGMSANVEIDTGRQRTIGSLLGLSDVAQAQERPAGTP